MAERMRARVVRVRVDRHGATLATAASIGDETLSVKDAGDCPPSGTLQLDDDAGTLLDFTSVTFVEDEDPTDLTSLDTITLAEPLAAGIDVGASLLVYEAPDDSDDTDDPVVAEVIARCVPEDDEDVAQSGEPVWAVVPQDKQEDLPPGRMAGDGVPVVLEWDDDTEEWFVARFRGKGDRGVHFAQVQSTVASVAVSPTVTLTHTPLDNSEHLYINGVEYTEDDGWSRTGRTITLDPDTCRVGDQIKVEYAYRGSPVAQAAVTAIVPFSSAGWSYKQIAAGDGTDYSGAGYDDSAWSVGATAFGGHTSQTISNAWAAGTRLWLRRQFPAATDVTIHVKVEDNAHLYVNGNLVGATPVVGVGGNITPGIQYDVPDAYLNPAGNVLAVRADDEYGESGDGGSSDQTFVDVQVSGRLS